VTAGTYMYFLFDEMIIEGLIPKKVFSVYLDSTLGDARSEIIFGGIDPKYAASVSYIPVISKTYWTINLMGVWASGVNYELSGCSPSNPCEAIVDTGTSYLVGPSQVNNIVNAIGVVHSSCAGVSKLPILTFNLGGKNFTLPPTVYVINDGGCQLAVQEDDNIPLWIFGDTFIRNYFTVFDREKNQVGFAPVKHRQPAHFV